MFTRRPVENNTYERTPNNVLSWSTLTRGNSMSGEAVRLLKSLRSSILNSGNRPKAEHTYLVVQDLIRIFIIDANFAVVKKLDVLLWQQLRELIDFVRNSPDAENTVDNTVSACIAWLTQFSLSLHMQYRILPNELPDFLKISSALLASEEILPVELNEFSSKKLVSFIALRMGDLTRYKKELNQSEVLYKIAVRTFPEQGDAWNQLALVASEKSKLIDALYYAVRALYSPTAFSSSTANINRLVGLYGRRDYSAQSPLQERFLWIYSKLHSMMEFDEHIVDDISVTDIRMVVPLIALCDKHSTSSDLESKFVKLTVKILQNAFSTITRQLAKDTTFEPSLLMALCLLFRVQGATSEISESDILSGIERVLESVDLSLLPDVEHIQHFTCLSSKDTFTYPLTSDQLFAKLQPDGKSSKKGKSSWRGLHVSFGYALLHCWHRVVVQFSAHV